MMLIMGKRAEMMHMERERREETQEMTKKLRSVDRAARTRTRLHLPPLHRHQVWTERLKKEEENHRLDLKVCTSDYFKRQDKKDTQVIRQRIDQLDRHAKCLKAKQIEIEEVQEKIKFVEKELRDVNKKMAARKKECSIFRPVTKEKVAVRFDLAVRELSEQLEQNRSLVAEIHQLRQERSSVSTLLKEVERDILDMSSELTAHVKAAQEKFVELSMSQKTKGQMDEHFNRKRDSWLDDMHTYELKINELKKKASFMLQKGKLKRDFYMEEYERLRLEPSPNEREVSLFHAAQEHVLDKLQKQDLCDVVETFVNLKEENYMLFRNMKETKNQIDAISTAIDRTKAKIKEIHSQDRKSKRDSHLLMQEISEKTLFCEVRADEQEGRLNQANEVIETYIQCVLHFLHKLGYTQQEITKLSAVYGKAEERNVLVFMGEIENYVDKLWQIQEYEAFRIHERRQREVVLPIPVTPLLPRFHQQPTLTLTPPSEDEDEADHPSRDSDVHPQDLHEIVCKVQQEPVRGMSESIAPQLDGSLTDTSRQAVGDAVAEHNPDLLPDIF